MNFEQDQSEISTFSYNVKILYMTLIPKRKKLTSNPYWCSRTAICTYGTSFRVRLVSEWELLKLLNGTFGPRFSGTSSSELIEKHSKTDNLYDP